jgi:hypothetical protein
LALTLHHIWWQKTKPDSSIFCRAIRFQKFDERL